MQVASKLLNMQNTLWKRVATVRFCCVPQTACSRSSGFLNSMRHFSSNLSPFGIEKSIWTPSSVARMFCTSQSNNVPGQGNQGIVSTQQPSVQPSQQASAQPPQQASVQPPQQPSVQPPQQPSVQPPQQRSLFSDFDTDSYQMSHTVRRRPYNLEAKMRMKQYRREAMLQRRQQELEEEQRTFQLDYTTIYQKGHPGTVQGVIKEIIHLGYIVTLPNGREGLLAASHLGCSGGIPLLERLFKVGQEITIRVIPVPNPAGKDRVYIRP